MDEFGKRLKSWASILENNTREQAERTATMPFIFPHVALMPDAHLGLGATIGSVIPTTGAVIPAAVGVDLGCLDRGTEFLSPSGWKKISDWEGEHVLVFNGSPRLKPGDFNLRLHSTPLEVRNV